MNAANKYRLQRELQVEPDVRHSSQSLMASLLGESILEMLSFIELTRGTIPLSDFGRFGLKSPCYPTILVIFWRMHTTHFSGGPTPLLQFLQGTMGEVKSYSK